MSEVALFSTYVETGNERLKFDTITITEISEWLKNLIRGSFCNFFSDSYELPTENSLQFKVFSKEEGGSFSWDDFQIRNKVLNHQHGTRRRKRCKEANRTFWWNVTKMAEKMKHRLFLWRSSIRFRSPRCQGWKWNEKWKNNPNMLLPPVPAIPEQKHVAPLALPLLTKDSK